LKTPGRSRELSGVKSASQKRQRADGRKFRGFGLKMFLIDPNKRPIVPAIVFFSARFFSGFSSTISLPNGRRNLSNRPRTSTPAPMGGLG
jgi:hypothetical protein